MGLCHVTQGLPECCRGAVSVEIQKSPSPRLGGGVWKGGLLRPPPWSNFPPAQRRSGHYRGRRST